MCQSSPCKMVSTTCLPNFPIRQIFFVFDSNLIQIKLFNRKMRNCRATANGFGLAEQEPSREGKLPVKNLQIFFRSLTFFFVFFLFSFIFVFVCFLGLMNLFFFTSCLGVSERVSFGYQLWLYLLWFYPVTVGTVEYFTRRSVFPVGSDFDFLQPIIWRHRQSLRQPNIPGTVPGTYI